MANIVEAATHDKKLTAFVAALRKTPLLDTLQGPGPFTVFAPTDDAFDNLPAGTVNRLLEDAEKLTAILAYHVVPGRFTSGDIARLSSAATTLEGSDLRIATTPRLTVNGAHVARSEVLADNGVIHVIDQLLLPLDDLGNVQVTYADVTVVEEPETVLVVEAETARKSAKRAGGKQGQRKSPKGDRPAKKQ